MATPKGSHPAPAGGDLGRKAVDLGLITDMQLREALAQVAQSPVSNDKHPSSLGSTLLRLGLLTQRQLDALHEDTASVRKKFGKYRIVRQLGRGGMGVVYEAIDADLGRTVALKMLLNSQQTDPKEVALEEERFIREARLSASLAKHPGIVGIYESGIHEGRRYIAMEYIDGSHFAEWCAKSTDSLRLQIGVLRDAALAVDHAHRHGVIHRDLKPANILVDVKGRPHVTDFGLAKQIRQDASLTLTGGGKVMGTPTYISPEQASGRKDVDRRTDVWALGIILYELLAGRPPFRGETPIDIMMKAVQDPVPLPSTVARGGPHRAFDRTIENICMKALAKEANRRYPTAKTFAEDLTRWIKGETVVIAAPPQGHRSAFVYWISGIAAVSAIAAGLILIPSSPSPDKIAAERRDRAGGLVTQGQRLLSQGNNADALVAFGEASQLDPENRAALAGKRDAERRIGAGQAIQTPRPPPGPAPATAPVPATPPPPSVRDLVLSATEFSRVNPKDIEGQIRVWQEAQKAAAGTPFAQEAGRELQAALARRLQAVTNELVELDHAVEALREAESFGPGREILAQAAKRHDDPEWVGAIQSRQDALRKTVYDLFTPIRDQAVAAKQRNDRGALEGLVARVARWKWTELTNEFDQALNQVTVKTAPAPAPAPAPDSGRPPGIGELPSLQGCKNGVRAAAFSPDGKLVIFSSFDKTVRLWDLAAHSEMAILVEAIDAPSVGFSSDGKWIAAGLVDGAVRIWDSGKLRARNLTGHSVQAIGVAFAPDSKTLASASTDGTVRLWDPATGAQKSQLEGHPKGAMAVAWSPDGKLVAVGCADHQIKLWDFPAGRVHRVLSEGIESEVVSVAFSPNGKLLLSGGKDARVCLWEVESGHRRVLASHSNEVRCVAFAPDGLSVASASADGTLRIWQAASGESRATFTDPAGFYGTVFSRKGDLLAGCSGSWTLRLWDLSAQRPPKSDSK
jgi:serine/threonine protein kinase